MKIVNCKIIKIEKQEDGSSFVKIIYKVPPGRKLYSIQVYKKDVLLNQKGELIIIIIYDICDTLYIYKT